MNTAPVPVSCGGVIAGGLHTSELGTHLQSHAVRKQVTGGGNRVIMHCHATNLIALSYVLELEYRPLYPRAVGRQHRVSGGVPRRGRYHSLDGSRDRRYWRRYLGKKTHVHSLLLWPFHGIFASGPSLNDAFGLIDTAEKSAEMMVKVHSMGGKKQTISRA